MNTPADGSAALSREELLEKHEFASKDAEKLFEVLKSQPKTHKDTLDKIAEMGLERNILQLEDEGYTVIPPEKVISPEMIKRLQDAILRVATERTGVPHALDKPGNPGHIKHDPETMSGNGYNLYYLLFEDKVFQEWLENDTLGTIMDYCLGGAAQLSSMMVFLRWANPDVPKARLSLPLHSDSVGASSGLVFNSALVLGPHTADDGAMSIVPGSHKLGRHPHPGECAETCIPVKAEPGSLMVWNGNTWHGAFQRRNPGIRLNLQCRFSHKIMKTMEKYQEAVPLEVLEGHSQRYMNFLGQDDAFGWGKNGPEMRELPGVGAMNFKDTTF